MPFIIGAGFTATGIINVGSTIIDLVSRGTGNELVVLCNGGNTVKRYSLASNTQQGADLHVTAQGAIGMVDDDHAATSSTTASSGANSIVNLLAGTVANVAAGVSFSSVKSQQIDGDHTSGIAFGAMSSAGSLLKWTTSAQSVVPFFPNSTSISSTAAVCSVTCEGNGTNKWVLGTVDGRIIEIDNNANVLNQMTLPPEPNRWSNTSLVSSSPFDSREITSLHFHNGWVIAGCTNGFIYLVNLKTRTVLQPYRYCSKKPSSFAVNLGLGGPIVSREGGINFISSLALADPFNSNGARIFYGMNNMIVWDAFLTPMKQTDYIWTANALSAINIGFDETKGYAWSANGQFIYVATFSGARTVVDQLEGTPNGGTVPGETIIIDDSGGVGTAKVLFHTTLAAGGQSVPITNALGANAIIKAANIGKGLDLQGSVNRETS